MNQITETQYEALQDKIYKSLIAMPEMGMGEMGECRDEAQRIVDEWLNENDITLLFIVDSDSKILYKKSAIIGLLEKENDYTFLYWEKENLDGDPLSATIKAENLEQACLSFLDKHNEDAIKVDYEVELNGKYIDITDHVGFENLI